MRVVCACGRRMQCAKVGDIIEELTEEMKPYQIWSSDRYRCSKCGTEVNVLPVGQKPIAEHFDDSYSEFAKRVTQRFV